VPRDRVYALFLDKADKVDGAVAFLRQVDSVAKGLVGEEVAVGNRFVNARKALVHYSARAYVEVPHFAVSLVPFGKPHGKARGGNDGAGICGFICIGKWGFCGKNRVGIVIPAFSPAVADDKADRSFLHERALLEFVCGLLFCLFGLVVEVPVFNFAAAFAGPAYPAAAAVAARAAPFTVGALLLVGAGLYVFFGDVGRNGLSFSLAAAEVALFAPSAVGAHAGLGGAERALFFVVAGGALVHARAGRKRGSGGRGKEISSVHIDAFPVDF
jgi:hypothetical protein